MVNKTQILMALLLSTALVQAQGKEDVYEIAAMKTHDLKELRLLHSNNSFAVLDHGKVEAVNPCWVDKEVRSVSTERLAKMLGHGYLSVNKMSNGEFSVKASVRGEGGGPATGMAVYWGVKSVLYGLIGGAAVATAVGTGAGIVVAVGGPAALAGAGVVAGKVAVGAPVAIAAKTVIVAAGVAGNVATGAAIAGAAAAPVVATTATAVVATGGWAALIAGIEGISAAAGIAAGMTPTP